MKFEWWIRCFPSAQGVAGAVFLTSGVWLAAREGSARAGEAEWGQFRGPNSSGVAAGALPPVEIGPDKGVAWVVEVPWSPSSPVVSGGRIFLGTVVGGELQTRCYDRRTGRAVWVKGITPDKMEMFHDTEGSPAAATPATDGRHVVNYFGSFGLICYDTEGNELWRHPMPLAMSGGSFGSGTSPVIAGKLVLLNRDQDMNSSFLALEVETGQTAWETARPGAGGSFGTPMVWRHDGLEEAVMPGSIVLKGYELSTGVERWSVEGVTGFACTTPVAGDGLLFFAGWSPGKSDAPWPTWESFLSTHDKNKDGEITLDEVDAGERLFIRALDTNRDGKVSKAEWDTMTSRTARAENALVAVRAGGRGDITKTHVAWKYTKGLPYVPSPLLYEGRLYLIKDGGMISSFEAVTGKPFYVQERLGADGSYYSSPVAADGRIYLASLRGIVSVIKAGGDKVEVLHRADFGERVAATPALAEGNLYLRTRTKLYGF